MTIKVAMNGACGKMGQAILRCLYQTRETEISGGIDRKDHPYYDRDLGDVLGVGSLGIKVTDNLDSIDPATKVIVDFSAPEVIIKLLDKAIERKLSLVIGTTGFSSEQEETIIQTAKKIPILLAPNMSVGVNVLFELVKKATKMLALDYDVEIIEAHHHFKKDAPSGTALHLLKGVKEEREKLGLNTIPVFARQGQIGERKKEEVGVFAIRAGDIVGEHNVMFAGGGERIELVHKAHNRENFALGAVRAVKYIIDKQAGLYTMKNVLGL